MQDDLPIYPIRTVASLTGVDARRLRSWESEYHLLEPARSKGGHRLYSPRDLRLVHLIRRLVDQEGMSLQGIKAFLAAQPDLADGSSSPPGASSQGGNESVEAGSAASRTSIGGPPSDPGSAGRDGAGRTPTNAGQAARGAARVATGSQAAGSAAGGGAVSLAARSHNGHGRRDRT